MPIPDEFIEALNRDADIVAVVGRHVKLQKKGNSHVGLCPFHQEKTPSFNVVPSKGFYHCFGCGASGTALRFLMLHAHNGDFLAAVEDLAATLGREVPRTSGPQRPKISNAPLERMARYYQEQLFKHPKIRKYLKDRGLDKETALRFRLGYAPPSGGLTEAFAKQPSDEELEKLGLLKRGDDGRRPWSYFRDRVMFPIEDVRGQVVGFGGRVLGDSEPKYLNSPQSALFDKGRIVYGLSQASTGIRSAGRILVVEGYMDVVALARHGVDYAVATMGTAATETQLRSILTRTDEAVFCFDGDAAGQRALRKVIGNVMPVLKDGKAVRFALLPAGEDPDSIVKAQGKDGVLKVIEQARSLEDMLLDPQLSEDEEEDASAAARSERWHKIADLLESVDRSKAAFLYEELYQRLHQASGIEISALREAASRSARPRTAPRPADGPPPPDFEPPWDDRIEEPVPRNQRRGRISAQHGKIDKALATFFACVCLNPNLTDDLKQDAPLLAGNEQLEAYARKKLAMMIEDYPALDEDKCVACFDDNQNFQKLVKDELKRMKKVKEDPNVVFGKLQHRFNHTLASRIRRQKELAAIGKK